MSKKMKKNKKDYFPDFSGKCLSISIRDDSTSHDVCDPHFEFQGERLFIIGTVPCGATASDWCENKTVAIAWDRVSEYYVFDDFKDYEKAVKNSENYHSKKKKKKK
jgi:hypothetical protein